jgi:hypothetical protein
MLISVMNLSLPPNAVRLKSDTQVAPPGQLPSAQ